MWNIKKQKGHEDRYRCHIGHSYSEKDLETKQVEIMENTLWVALRIMEERKTLLTKMELDNIAKGLNRVSAGYRERREQLQIHIDRLKEVVYATQKQD
jgi:two-component system chemotaxis response regulator CheB